MNAKEILEKINQLTFTKFGDINLGLIPQISKEILKEVGEFELVLEKQDKGKEILNIRTPYFIYNGKGEFRKMIYHFKAHQVFISERRLYIPKVPHGSCVDYQGSEFFEVKPKGKGFEDVEELF